MRAATTLAGMTTPRRTGGMHGTPCSATPRPRSKRFRHGHIGEIEGLQIRERRERAEWCRDAVDTETQARQLREPGEWPDDCLGHAPAPAWLWEKSTLRGTGRQGAKDEQSGVAPCGRVVRPKN